MRLLKNKNMLSAIAVLMILSFAMTMIALPDAIAQTTRKTYPFVDAVPMTAGVGQQVLINFGLLNQLNNVDDFWNVILKITDPDDKSTEVPLKTWSTGTAGHMYTPQKVGEYQLQCIFKGQTYNGAKYEESESEIIILTVTEERKPDYPGFDMPSNYWTRPVDSQLREWWTIMGSWLVNKPANLYAPWNQAPESAHVLWTMPVGDTMGGLSGGDNWEYGFQTGDAYEGKFAGAIIIAGVLYYNRYVSGAPQQTIVAVDLHTGKTLWERSYNFGGNRISRGQILTFSNYNNRGTWAYIWMVSGTNWFALDALTGDLKYNMTSVPSGTVYYGPNGEMLIYSITGTAATGYRLLQWNSTWVVANGKTGMAEAWGSQIQGVTYNAGTRGYDKNVTISLPGATSTASIGSLLMAYPEDRIIYGNYSAAGVSLTALSLDPENFGTTLFARVFSAAPDDWARLTTSGTQSGCTSFSQEDQVAILWTKENRVNYAYSLKDGKYMWKTDSQNYADAWAGATANSSPEKLIAYGRLLEAGPSGIVHCYNITTGAELWFYEVTDKYTESYIRENWWVSPCFIADHKIYVGHREHSVQDPKPRGAPFLALDIETGKVVWEIDGMLRQTMWGGRAIIGDSIIATMDTYDQQIYAIGKGPVALTVSAPDVGIAVGTPVMIKGTIMDVSPGTQTDKMQLRFPNGVPAVSDKSMSEWMLYIYKQFPQPKDVEGVEVTIYTHDPNGNDYALGTAKSDASGRFSFEFKPETEGQYTIYAIFNGSASYYGNVAQNEMTAMKVEVKATPPYELYIIVVGIAIILTVILVGLLNFFKKR
jgi:hypothetical protein